MKHSFIARLFACLLALMLPIGALAENPVMDMLKAAKDGNQEIVVTLSSSTGKNFQSLVSGLGLGDKLTTAVSDLLNSTAVRVIARSGGLAQFALLLSGEEALSAQLRAGADGTYFQSDAISARTLYLSTEDVEEMVAKQSGSLGAGDPALSQMTGGFSTGFLSGLNTQQDLGLTEDSTPEEVEAAIVKAMDGDDSLVKWMKDLRERTVVTKGEFAGEDHDTADTKCELTLTQDDFSAMFDMPFMKKNFTAQLQARGMAEAEAAAEAERMIAEAKDELAKQVINVPITCLTIGETELVSLEIAMTGTFTYDVTTTTYIDKADAESAEGDVADIPEEELPVEITDDATFPGDDDAADELESAPFEFGPESDEEYAPRNGQMEITETETRVDAIAMPMTLTRKTTDEGVTYHATARATVGDSLCGDIDATAFKNTANAITASLRVNLDEKPAFTVNASYTPDGANATGDIALEKYDNQGVVALGAVLTYDRAAADQKTDFTFGVNLGANAEAAKNSQDDLMTFRLSVEAREPGSELSAILEATPETSVRPSQMTDDEMSAFASEVQGNAIQTLFALIGKLPSSVFDLVASFMNGVQ